MTQITPNFNVEKDGLSCRCCGAWYYNPSFWSKIQALRDMLGIPFIVNSAYRCRIYNDAIGGSKGSRHLYGDAVDISTLGWTGNQKHQLIELACSLSMSIGVYSDFIHLDLRPMTPILFYGES
jgi:uncharacterized protein YcbK (DUF882 family)